MRRESLVPALVIALLLSPAAQAAVYKCTSNGEARYQDQPCPGAREQKPHIEDAPAPAVIAPSDAGVVAEPATESSAPSAPAPAPPTDDGSPLDRVGQLHLEIDAAQAAQRNLLAEYRQAVQALAATQAGREGSPGAQEELRQLEQAWKERRYEAGERVRSLRDELRRLCPNGTMMSGTRQACR